MSDIKDKSTHDREAKEKTKELGDQVKKQEVTVKDKTRAADLAGRLKQEGTKEGAERVRKAVEKAAKAIDTHLEKQTTEHDKIAKDGKTAEGELDKSSKAASQDAKNAEKAGSDITTEGGKAAVKEVAAAAQQDEKWLAEVRKKRESNRTRSEKETKDQVRKAKSIRVQTKR